MIEMKEALSGVGASEQSKANESSTTQNYTMPDDLGQIFALIKECNDLIQKDEQGVGYALHINRYSISLDYHYISPKGDSKLVKFIDEDFESTDQLIRALDKILLALRNIRVMKRAGL